MRADFFKFVAETRLFSYSDDVLLLNLVAPLRVVALGTLLAALP